MAHTFLRLVLLFQLVMFAACADHAKPGTDAAKNMYLTDSADPAMNAAMDIARTRFGAFDSAYESGKYDKDKFSIKVKYPQQAGNEYIWLVDISKVDGHYMGVVSDTPRETKVVKFGDRPVIDNDDVVDWLYGKDSILHGGYTLRLIYGRLSKEELERERATFPYKIED
ncbi:MAG TPA: DUF2314 domain-containing protein [Puia sp.]|nr:DUF2314 domain-containing protein [Puia sp.]